ncbi:MAG: hypothetical protein HY855_12060 [Burkholderiales bacterium]|nr:hypothetical protein [Burkholderiales bacterium]
MGLRASDYQRLLAVLPGRYLVLLPDAPRFTVVEASQACAPALGQPLEAVLGQPVAALFRGDAQALHASALRRSLQKVLRSGRADTMAAPPSAARCLNQPVLAEDGSVACIVHCMDGELATSQLSLHPEGAHPDMATELRRRVERHTRQLRKLAAELEAAENRERRQIAHDLHDDLGQTLAAARIRLTALCRHERPEVSAAAAEVAALIDNASASTRSLAAQLAPAILFELGLLPALEWLGEELQASFGLHVTVLDDGQPKPLTHEARSVLYRAVRELLINVAKHAGTDAAVVHLRRRAGRLLMRVSDAGVGFDPEAVSARPRRGLGLLSVRERLSFIGGTMKLRAMPGDGTVALLSAPLGDDEPSDPNEG